MKTLKILRAGQVKPGGWLREQMLQDLEQGFVGCLDELLPALIISDEIYGRDRRSFSICQMDLGLSKEEDLDPVHLQWWNSETQSQWYDGLIRHAFLLENKKFMQKSDDYVSRMLSFADENGYMGIYDSASRYNLQHESGELWAQATLFRALLSYYDLTGKKEVLEAVEKAVCVTMTHYHPGRTDIFSFEQTHGLMFSDILEYLYALTQNPQYVSYMEYLYQSFCHSQINMGFDLLEKNILNPEYRPKCHGVHTYEHLRALTTLAYLSDNPYYRALLEEYQNKLKSCICPSGGGIGDEWIFERSADAALTGYEFCSLQELVHSYFLLFSKTGDFCYADNLEQVFFNAAQGSRHPRESCIAYLNNDNCYFMLGDRPGEHPELPQKSNIRYKFSPTHQDAAVCCIPNAGRLPGYYLQASWYENEKGVVKALYGASTFTAQWKKACLTITEDSLYPGDGKLHFHVSLSAPEEMELTFRIPGWCTQVIADSPVPFIKTRDALIFHGTWPLQCEISIHFVFDFAMHFDLCGDAYFTYGPLVLALPLKFREIAGKEYPVHGLRDLYYELCEALPDLQAGKSTAASLHLVHESANWKELSAEAVFQTESGTTRAVLMPMAGSILRKVTFPFLL